MKSPDVTVVIAAKNEQLHVESAATSVLQQSGVRHEVVFVDDGSTDQTYGILTSIADADDRLSVHRNPGVGKCSAFNFGVRQARGRFVCIFAGDDIMPAGSLAARLEKVTNLPDEEPGIGLCKIATMSDMKRFDGHLVPRAPGRGALSGMSPLMNRKAVEKIFPVPESLPNEDTWMELAVLHFPRWNVVHSDIVGCRWRVHAGNSINMLLSFHEYNSRITARMQALSLFDQRHGAELTDKSRRALRAKIECEERRTAGDILGVLRSPVGITDRLRALSITTPMLYSIRRWLYGLLSGW